MFENIEGLPVDRIRINGNDAYKESRTLEEVKNSEHIGLTKEQEKILLETIEKTFEDDIFVKKQYQQDPSHYIKLDFYNRKLGLSKSLLYIKKDKNYKEEILLGVGTLIILIGIPILIKGLYKKHRFNQLKKRINGLEMLKYEAANLKTKKVINILLKSDKI